MNLDDIQTKCYILALFKRSDGERFLLGSGAYEFDEKLAHFSANSFSNDVVEIQGNDGVMLAGQVRRATTQVFSGYIGDATVPKTEIENYRRAFFRFFRKGFYYTVVYIFNDGTAIQRRKGFIANAPEVKEMFQLFPGYSVGLNFEDVNYYSYAEDADGNEAYTKSLNIFISHGAEQGGLIWDSVGATWDDVGAIWAAGSGGGPTIVNIDSISTVYPVWEVAGPSINPQISVLTTGTTLTYNGTITSSQKLVVNMFDHTATLNGVNVLTNISGNWINLAPGENRVTYADDDVNATSSKIYWQEIVG